MVIEQSSDSRVSWVTTSERRPLKRLNDRFRTPSHSRGNGMPMIVAYAAAGTFGDKHTLAQDLAKAVMRWEQVPEISLFKHNTAAFVHDLPAAAISNAAGETSYVPVERALRPTTCGVNVPLVA
jgi:hypothetical protein